MAPGELWSRAALLFEQALDQPPEARTEYLRRVTGEDGELRGAVESLLAFDDNAAISPPLPAPFLGESAHIGAYRLVQLLSEGGMGSVWLGERSGGEIRQRVAVKLLHRQFFGRSRNEPGISSVMAGPVVLGMPLCHRNDVVTVIPATASEDGGVGFGSWAPTAADGDPLEAMAKVVAKAKAVRFAKAVAAEPQLAAEAADTPKLALRGNAEDAADQPAIVSAVGDIAMVAPAADIGFGLRSNAE